MTEFKEMLRIVTSATTGEEMSRKVVSVKVTPKRYFVDRGPAFPRERYDRYGNDLNVNRIYMSAYRFRLEEIK